MYPLQIEINVDTLFIVGLVLFITSKDVAYAVHPGCEVEPSSIPISVPKIIILYTRFCTQLLKLRIITISDFA